MRSYEALSLSLAGGLATQEALKTKLSILLKLYVADRKAVLNPTSLSVALLLAKNAQFAKTLLYR